MKKITNLILSFVLVFSAVSANTVRLYSEETEAETETEVILNEEEEETTLIEEETEPGEQEEISVPEETEEGTEILPEEAEEITEPEENEEPAPEEDIPEVTEEPGDEEVLPEEGEEKPAEEEVSPEEEEEEPAEEETFEYTVSEAEMEGKAALIENGILSALPEMEEGKDYAADEVMYLCDSRETAETVADIFEAELISFGDGVAVASLADSSYTVEEAVSASVNDPELPLVEPNYLVEREPEICTDEEESQLMSDELPEVRDWSGWVQDTFVDPDPYISEPGSTTYQWQHDMINTYAGWNATMSDSSVLVAVIDGTVNGSHEDLRGRVSYEDIGCGTSLSGGHGTHVAGIIAASADNGLGGAGIAPNVSILSINIFEYGNKYAETADIVAAINRAVDSGAWIINMSIGGYMYNYSYEQAVNRAYYRGVTIFAAAGNNEANIKNFPAAYDKAVAVGSVTRSGYRSWYSNYGTWVDISAPGSNIMSTSYNPDSPGDNSYYEIMSGTSMATPVVTGAAALYMSKMGHVSPDEIKTVLKKNTTKCRSKQMGGIVNLQKLFAGDKDAPVINIYDSSWTPYYTLTQPLEDGSFAEIINADPGDQDTVIYTVNGKKPSVKNGQIINGIVYDGYIDLDELPKSSTVKLMAATVNSLGVMGAVKTVTIKTRVPAPAPVKIVKVVLDHAKASLNYHSEEPESFTLLTSTLIDQLQRDADLSTVEHEWLSSNEKVAVVDENGTVTAAGPGTAKITLKILDGSKKTAVCTVTVIQLPEDIEVKGQDALAAGTSATFTASVKPASTKNKKVTWELSSEIEGVTISNKGKLSVAPYVPQDTEIIVRAVSAETNTLIGEKTVTVCPKAVAVQIVSADERAVYSAKTGKMTSIQLFTTNILDNGTDLDETETCLEGIITGNDIAPVWTSSNPKVAKVSSDGTVTALSKGTTKITCLANDGSKKKATVTVKVIVPVSGIALDIGEYGVRAVGKPLSMNQFVGYGTAYGTPSLKKVRWSVTKVIYEYADDEYDITDEVLAKKYVRTDSTGKLITSKTLAKAFDIDYGNLYVTVRATAADGSGFYSEDEVLIKPPVKGITFEDPYGYGYYCYTDSAYEVALYADQPCYIQITCSKPGILGAFVDYESIEADQFWIYRNGRTTYYSGFSYWVDYFTYPNKRGTVTLTAKALDGSGKKAKLKIQIK